MASFVVKILILTFFTVQVSGRIFEKCELAMKLLELEVPMEHIPRLVSISQTVAGFNTKYHNGHARGLFGVYEGVWCDADSNTKLSKYPCQVSCNEITSSVSRAVACAMTVIKVQGYPAWGIHFKDFGLDYLKECDKFVYIHKILDKYCLSR